MKSDVLKVLSEFVFFFFFHFLLFLITPKRFKIYLQVFCVLACTGPLISVVYQETLIMILITLINFVSIQNIFYHIL